MLSPSPLFEVCSVKLDWRDPPFKRSESWSSIHFLGAYRRTCKVPQLDELARFAHVNAKIKNKYSQHGREIDIDRSPLAMAILRVKHAPISPPSNGDFRAQRGVTTFGRFANQLLQLDVLFS